MPSTWDHQVMPLLENAIIDGQVGTASLLDRMNVSFLVVIFLPHLCKTLLLGKTGSLLLSIISLYISLYISIIYYNCLWLYNGLKRTSLISKWKIYNLKDKLQRTEHIVTRGKVGSKMVSPRVTKTQRNTGHNPLQLWAVVLHSHLSFLLATEGISCKDHGVHRSFFFKWGGETEVLILQPRRRLLLKSLHRYALFTQQHIYKRQKIKSIKTVF